jgi:hypothetical protein
MNHDAADQNSIRGSSRRCGPTDNNLVVLNYGRFGKGRQHRLTPLDGGEPTPAFSCHRRPSKLTLSKARNLTTESSIFRPREPRHGRTCQQCSPSGAADICHHVANLIGRKTKYDLKFATDATMYFTLPILIFSALAQKWDTPFLAREFLITGIGTVIIIAGTIRVHIF